MRAWHFGINGVGLVLGLAIVGLSLGMPVLGPSGPGGGFLPIILGAMLALTSLALLVQPLFQGGAPGITAALGGHVEIGVAYTTEYRGHMEAGKIRAVGVAGDKRLPISPDVMTFNEAIGSNKLLWQAWRYVSVPKGTPADRRRFLDAWIGAALEDPELQEEYRKTGAIVDRTLVGEGKITAEVERLIGLERAFYERTGRLK